MTRSRGLHSRARGGGDLVAHPQAHGGTLWARPPRPAPVGGFRATRRIAFDLLNAATPAAAATLLALTDSRDERVAVMALTQLLDRSLGKPTDTAPAGTNVSHVDLAQLRPAERAELLSALAVIREPCRWHDTGSTSARPPSGKSRQHTS